MLPRQFRLFLLLLLLVTSAPVFATGRAVVVTPGIDHMALAGFLHASPQSTSYADADAAFNAYKQGQFEPLPGNLGRGYRKEDVWLAFDIDLSQIRLDRLIVEVGPAYLDRVTAHMTWQDGSLLRLGLAGDHIPAEVTPLHALKPTFTANIPAGQTQTTVLLHIHTSSTQSAQVRLFTAAGYQTHILDTGLLLGFMLTISFGVLLLTLSLYFLSRDVTYLMWLGYMAITASLWVFRDGIAYLYLPFPQGEWISITTNVLGALSASMLILSVTYMFEFRQISPWLHRIFVAWPVAVIVALAAGLAADIMFVPYLVYLGTLPLVLVSNAVVLWMMWRRQRQALLFGTPHLIYSGMAMLNVIANAGWLPFSQFTFYAWQVAGVLYLLALQFAILDRARQAQNQLTQTRQRLVAELADRNRKLEEQVAARTAELSQALSHVQQAENEQRQLLSMASHEFRTPAAMIKASLDSLRFLEPKIPPEVMTRIDNIRQASTRLTRLANDLIDQDRLLEQSMTPRLKRVDLCAIVRETMESYARPPWLRARLPDQPVWVDADAVLLGIALNNLIDNAMRYGEAEAGGVLIELRNQPERAELRVSDRGPGIPDAEKDRVFQRFYGQADHAPTADRTSSGLGLHILQGIACIHQGSVRIEDNLPHGATFIITLPMRVRAPAG